MNRCMALLATLAIAVGIAAQAPLARAAEEPALDPAQVEEIERIVRDYLLAHPEVIFEAIGRLQERERIAKAERRRTAIAANRTTLYDNPHSPVTGNLEGDVTVIEFFDYRCPYCKRVAVPLLETVNDDGNVRLVFKEYPILGPDSVFAARAALAARVQGDDKYREFHFALMRSRVDLTQAAVMAFAGAVGLDLDKLRQDMDAPEIGEEIRQNHILAGALEIDGTPAFIIGDTLAPGALSLGELKALIARTREAKS